MDTKTPPQELTAAAHHQGRRLEREAIVAWLRSEADRCDSEESKVLKGASGLPIKANYWREAADAIEKGDHLKK